jgi:hypothetical protein
VVVQLVRQQAAVVGSCGSSCSRFGGREVAVMVFPQGVFGVE